MRLFALDVDEPSQWRLERIEGHAGQRCLPRRLVLRALVRQRREADVERLTEGAPGRLAEISLPYLVAPGGREVGQAAHEVPVADVWERLLTDEQHGSGALTRDLADRLEIPHELVAVGVPVGRGRERL